MKLKVFFVCLALRNEVFRLYAFPYIINVERFFPGEGICGLPPAFLAYHFVFLGAS